MCEIAAKSFLYFNFTLLGQTLIDFEPNKFTTALPKEPSMLNILFELKLLDFKFIANLDEIEKSKSSTGLKVIKAIIEPGKNTNLE